MKIETTGREFKAAMRLVKGVVNPGIVPWSATLLWVTEDGGAFLEACDGERSVRISLEESCGNKPGVAAVATHRLCEIASAIGGKEPVTLEGVAEALVVTGASSRSWTAPLILKELDDVVAVQAAVIGWETHHFSLPRAALVRLLGRVSYAMSDEQTRYYLNGVYLHVAEGQLKTAATDGARMAVAEMPAPEGATGMAGVILPRDTVLLLEKALVKATAEEVTITCAAQRVAFSWPGFRLITKLVDGIFPAYERAIPKKNGCVLTFDADSLTLEAVAAPGARKRGNRMILTLSEGKSVGLEMENHAELEAKTSVTDQFAHYTGAPLSVAFQPRLFHSVVSHLQGAAELHLKDGREPALILDQGDPGVRHVLMSMPL